MSAPETVPENNIKTEEENVEKPSGSGFFGFSSKGFLILGVLAMFLISTAIALGVGLHFAAAKRNHHHKRVHPAQILVDASLSDYVQPL